MDHRGKMLSSAIGVLYKTFEKQTFRGVRRIFKTTYFTSKRQFSSLEPKVECDIDQRIRAHAVPARQIIGDDAFSEAEAKQFSECYPEIVKELIAFLGNENTEEAAKRLTNMFDYNVRNFDYSKGYATVIVYKYLRGLKNITEEEEKLANILGWCVIMIESSLLICDDLMDNSQTRFGQPCWYRRSDVHMEAVNDVGILNGVAYLVLRKRIADKKRCSHVMEALHDCTIGINVGQLLDMEMSGKGNRNLERFTPKTYDLILDYKAVYPFLLASKPAMYLADVYDSDRHEKAKEIVTEIGKYFQTENDFFDCYGGEGDRDVIGSDIKEGKCSWLAVTALQNVLPSQRKIMENHYGKGDEMSIKTIRQLYDELDLPKLYQLHQENRLRKIARLIDQLPKDLPQSMFHRMAKIICKSDF